MTKIGHNSGDDDMLDDSPEALRRAVGNPDNLAAEPLRLFIERIERLREEKKGIADDERDVFSEAKSQGYDTKMMRVILTLRKMTPEDREEMEAILDTYKSAMGMA
jgi:uncharacterized protein (UPF0335 family)